MDAISNPDVHTVAVMASAQVGKTEIELNAVGFYIDQDPSPIMVIMPTVGDGEGWSKDRLAPMLRDTPCLKGRVADPRVRDSGNTILHKTFAGGNLTIVGANSPAGLAGRPKRILLADEIDRFPESAGAEGDPFNLAKKRTTRFWNRKVVAVSTPTIKGKSRIEKLYNEGDCCEYYVVCPDCDHAQTLRFENVHWDKDATTGEHLPETAVIACESCGSAWPDGTRWRLVNTAERHPHGGWRGTRPLKGIASFRIHELYSTRTYLKDYVSAFLEAQGDPQQLKVWTNTANGEVWDDAAESIAPESMKERVEGYSDDLLPEGVLLLTVGADVQADRIEASLWGFGAGEEMWNCGHYVFRGDTELPPDSPDSPWPDYDLWKSGLWYTEDGRALRCHADGVDAGYIPDKVHAYVRPRSRRRCFALVGKEGSGPIWPASHTRREKQTRDKYYTVRVDQAKSLLYGRLNRIHEHGPGYVHFPVTADDEYFAQLTAEVLIEKKSRGRMTRLWKKTRERNEALDCFCYAYAVFLASGGGAYLRRLMLRMGRNHDEQTDAAPTPPAVLRRAVDMRDPPEDTPPIQSQSRRNSGDAFLKSRRSISGRRKSGWLKR